MSEKESVSGSSSQHAQYRDTCPHGMPKQPFPETCDDCDMEELPEPK